MARILLEDKCVIGKRFARFTVTGPYKLVGKRKEKHFPVKCDCGSERLVSGASLVSGNSKSCGCIQGEKRHNKSLSREYYSWKGMIQRCENPDHTFYDLYGGRGILVCDRWHDFRNFYADMGERQEKTTLDRIDNFGNYEPVNCRWATQKTQIRNMRANLMIYHDGRWAAAIEWAELSPVDYNTFLWRHKRGWGMDKIMSTPSKMTANKGVPKPEGFRKSGEGFGRQKTF